MPVLRQLAVPALVFLLFGCGVPDQLTYHVSCGSCRVRYSAGDSVATVRVTDKWYTTVRVLDQQLYGMHVDSISGIGAAYAFISLGGDMVYAQNCTFNESCDLSYVGQVKLPWWAAK